MFIVLDSTILDTADKKGGLRKLGYTQFRGKKVADYASVILEEKYRALILKAIQSIRKTFSFQSQKDSRTTTSRTPIDYSGFDFPLEDVAVDDKVALMLKKEKLTLGGNRTGC